MILEKNEWIKCKAKLSKQIHFNYKDDFLPDEEINVIGYTEDDVICLKMNGSIIHVPHSVYNSVFITGYYDD